MSDMRVTGWQKLDSLDVVSEAEEADFYTAHKAWSWCRKFAYAYTDGGAHIGQVLRQQCAGRLRHTWQTPPWVAARVGDV